MLDSPPAVPDFSLLRRIGRGSYGDVWLARSVTGVYRAVKLVYRSRFDEDRPYEREFAGIQKFEPISVGQETQVSVLHVGRNEAAGFFYYVMELADDAETGEEIVPEKYVPKTLKEMRTRQNRLSPAECLSIGIGLTRALAHLHRHGLVHRDIKPSNVIFVHGMPKLADIGLVSAVDTSASFVGTEGFVPPEGPGSVSADLYGLGKVIYEISTGRDRKEFPKLPDDLDRLTDARALLEVNEVTIKACDPDLRRRYSSAQTMHEELLLLQAGKSVRRLHLIERRFKIAAKYAAAATILTLLAAAAFFWASFQARKAKENFALSERHRHAAEKALRESRLNEARASHMTGLAGHRFDTLALIRKGSVLSNRLELRNEAIACLALPDLRPVRKWAKTPDWDSWDFDSQLGRYSTNDAAGNIIIRDLETDQQLEWVPADGAPLTYGFGSPDDRFIATTDTRRKARIWDVQKRRGTPIAFPKGAQLMAFTPDSQKLVIKHADRSFHFLNSTSAIEERVVPGPFAFDHIQFSPSGTGFVGLVGHNAIIYDATNGSVLATLDHPERIMVVAWHPDGRRLATGCGKAIHFWDVPTARQIGIAQGHEARIVGLAFHKAGELLASVSWDGSIRLWHADTHRELLKSAQGGNALCISPDGRRLAFKSWDHSEVELWELADAREVRRIQLPLPLERSASYDGDFSPDGRLLFIQNTDGVYIFESGTHCLVAIVPCTVAGKAAFHPSGNRLITCGNEGLRLWPIRSSSASEVTIGPPEAIGATAAAHVGSFSLSSDGKRLVAVNDAGFRVFDPLHPAAVVQSRLLSRQKTWPIISPNGCLVASADSSKRLQIWDARNCNFLTNINTSHKIEASFFSADNRWLVTAIATEYRFWDTGSWKAGVSIPQSIADNARACCAFSPDGKLVALAVAHGAVRLFVSGTDHELATFPTSRLISALNFSPDGTQLLITCETAFAQLWDLRLIRQELAEMNLDWDEPSFPPSATPDSNGPRFHAPTIQITVITNETVSQDSSLAATSSNAVTIPLTNFYNGELAKGWIPSFSMGSTSEHTLPVPVGLNTFAGVPFDVHGVLQLSSRTLKKRGGKFPERVNRIPIGRHCQRLHFLDGADWSVAKGTVIGGYLVSYTNGEEQIVPIIYGQDLLDWWQKPGPPNSGPIVAWTGTNPASERKRASIRVYRSTWENPFPELEVRSVDCISTMTACGPFLLGITAE